MGAYIIRRLIMAVIILIIVTLIVFFAIRLLPGDPLLIFLGTQATQGGVTEAELDQLREFYGLNEPIMAQYGNWLFDVLRGDLGQSYTYNEDVNTLLSQRFPVTIQLGLSAFIIANVFGILLGMAAAIRRGTWIDAVTTTLANIGITIPIFWLGILMILTFGLYLGWLPIGGWTPLTKNFWESVRASIMPVACLAVTQLAGTARTMRSSMLEIVRQDYIRTAWSKGLQERSIIIKHALKNSLIPIVTLAGIGLGIIMGGSVFIETVFGIPGVGRLIIQGVMAQDYVIIQSSVLVLATIIILSNLVVDISYGWLDPRIRYG